MRNGELSNVIAENIVVHLDSIVQLKDLNLWEKLKIKFSTHAKEQALKSVNMSLYNYVHKLIRKTDFAVILVTEHEPIYKYMASQQTLFLPCGVCYVRSLSELKELFNYRHVSFFITSDEEKFNKGIPQAITFEEFSRISGVK